LWKDESLKDNTIKEQKQIQKLLTDETNEKQRDTMKMFYAKKNRS
jgi:hypothetical protein